MILLLVHSLKSGYTPQDAAQHLLWDFVVWPVRHQDMSSLASLYLAWCPCLW